jgi:hypothetical protein
MHTLTDRLDDLADDAPTGGAPASEIWARGKRAYRLRAAGLVATVLMVGAAGTGIGLDLAGRGNNRVAPAPPAVTTRVALPIEYPVGKRLPDLGFTPGPLAAVWVVPRVGGGRPEVVGLVAQTGRFGTLPIHVSTGYARGAYLPLSPDGRRIAYYTHHDACQSIASSLSVHGTCAVVVRDLVSGESYAPVFKNYEPTEGFTWVDATHLVGQADMNGDGMVWEAEGWAWEPGKTAPKEINVIAVVGSPYLWEYAGIKPSWFGLDSTDPQECLSLDRNGTAVLCDLVGVISSEIALTHDGDGAVIALDIRGVEDETLRHVVAAPGAPPHVTFATDLIAYALGVDAGAS